MKKLISFSLLLLLSVVTGSSLLRAQEGNDSTAHAPRHTDQFKMKMKNHEAFGIAGLTEDQKAKIKDLRMAHFREVQPLINQLAELKAHQRTLATAETPDTKAIESNIDEITKVLNQLMKVKAGHNQKVRAILTPDQRIAYDMRHMKHKGHDNLENGPKKHIEIERHLEHHADNDKE